MARAKIHPGILRSLDDNPEAMSPLGTLNFLLVKPLNLIRALVPAFLLICGMYFPTSIAGTFSEPLYLLHMAIFLGVCIFIILMEGFVDSIAVLFAISIVALLFGSSLMSEFHDYRPGGVTGFFCFAVLCCVPLRRMRASRSLLLAVNALNFIAGAGMILGNQTVDQLIRAHYSIYYPELLKIMILAHKPVLTFGTHSLAAMAFYLFFWLCLETYKAKKEWLFLASAILYAALTLALTSVAGLAIGAIMVAQLAWGAINAGWGSRILTLLLTVAAIALASWTGIWALAKPVFSSDTNGLLGRYSGTGTLAWPLHYALNHPFSPIGFTYSPNFSFLGDSGAVQYFVRGSLPLLVCMYAAAYRFLRHNLLATSDAVRFIIVLAIFETGFTLLTQERSLYLLAFAVVYLNELRAPAEPHSEGHLEAREGERHRDHGLCRARDFIDLPRLCGDASHEPFW